MKSLQWLAILLATVCCWSIPDVFAVEPTQKAILQAGQTSQSKKPAKPKQIHLPLHRKSSQFMQRALQQAQAGATLPLWGYGLISPVDGKLYQGTMVGRSPFFNGHRTTNIQVQLIPVILTFEDTGTVFDPTTFDSCLGDSVMNFTLHSPLFNNAHYVMNGVDVGNAQYIDAFQRGNFWNQISATGNSYHTNLTVTVMPAQSLTVPFLYGETNVNFFNGCAYGLMDGNWWDSTAFGSPDPDLARSIIAQLGPQQVGPNTLPVFVFNSVFEYIGNLFECCVLGYHDSYSDPAQTYSAEGLDTSDSFGGDVSVMSHELAEWLDDPVITNTVPQWGHIGQQADCQDNLEVGDPTSPNNPDSPPYNPFLVSMNGRQYTLQELAYFSWFFRQSPSLGSGGLYSDNGTFTTDAGAVCQ
jgi:hypothetical protein